LSPATGAIAAPKPLKFA